MIKNTISFLPERFLMNETPLFSILDCVDSTNNYAMGQVHAGLANHGRAWFAHEQTAGKGQWGRHWESIKGKNIALSIAVLPSGIKMHQQFRLSVAISLGCFDFFYDVAGIGTSIKWPNDIYWGDRKAGGILIENIIQGKNWKYAIIGIGINTNQVTFNKELANAISLKQITGQDYDTVRLAKLLHVKVMARINALNENSFTSLLAEYNSYLYKQGLTIKLKKGNVSFGAIIRGVTETGKLKVEGAGENEFNFGEVQWLIE